MNKIIALWSHPRSMSTAMERVMRERGDLTCAHEPFMYYYYLNVLQKPFPGFDAQEDHPTTYAGIRDMLIGMAEENPVFFKDMAYYVLPEIIQDPAFMERVTHCFLIRHPLASILSYHKLDPQMSCQEIGLEDEWKLYQAVTQAGHDAVVIEAETVRADTRATMARLWERIEINFREEAFDWNKKTPEDWEQVSSWHEQASSSSGIRAADAEEMLRKEAEFEALAEEAPHLRTYLRHHLPFYERLSQVALLP
ncbi:MAG: hypothetical protein RID23_15485 [Roseovarius sp.]